MKTKFYLPLLLLLSNFSMAQLSKTQLPASMPNTHEQCLSDQMHQRLMQMDPAYAQIRAEEEAHYQEVLNNPFQEKTTYTIPVVVHVIHTGQAVGTGINISDAQIQSAITNLNAAFSNTNTAFTTYTGANTSIQFCLAQRDASNNPTTGIVRVNGSGVTQYSTKGVCDAGGGTGTDNEVAVKALSKWDNTKYYNIWIVSEINDNGGGAGTQGYAYFPGAGSSVDGAIMLYNAFGYDPDGSLAYNLKSYTNRNVTAVHEIGHALNLYHTFQGDGTGSTCPTDAVCGTSGDCVGDTPRHKRSTSGCVADGTANACQGGTTAGDYQHNFMDYSSDVCQTRFTANQITRMQAVMTGTRASLNASAGCNPVYATEISMYAIVSPSNSSCGTTFTPEVQVKNTGSGSVTSFTISYNIDGGANQTYNWTGTLTSGSTVNVILSDITTTAGAHTFNATTSIPNGIADPYTTNDSKSFAWTVVGNPPTAASCSPTTLNTGNYGTGIIRVQFNTLDNAHDDTNNDGLQDFSCLYSTTVSTNTAYTLTVTGDPGNGQRCLVFIDYDDDGIFESGELVLNNNASTNTSFSQSVTIPEYPEVTGKLVRMRVITDVNFIGTDGCTDVDYGEFEDYAVFITTPPCGAPTITSQPSNLSFCTGNTGSFTIVATGSSPKTYQWQVDDGTGYVNVSNGGIYSGATTASLTISGASSGSNGYQYQCYVSNGCGNATSNAVTLTSLASPAATCYPATTNTGNFSTGIIRFQMNTIDNVHNDFNNDGTQDFVCTDYTTVTAGSTYAFTVTGYGGTLEYGRICIDFNDDGDFADAGETVYNNNTTKQASHTGNIVIPSSGITTGKLIRMRVHTNFNTIPTPLACANYTYGESEDYGIYIPCITPTVATSTPDARCDAGTLTLGATASAGTIKWYDASSGGNLVGTGTSYTTPSISSTTTYYAEAVQATCISAARTAVVAAVGGCTQLRSVYCGRTLTALSEYMSADNVPSATSYRFKITDGTNTFYYTSATYGIRLTLVPGIKHGTTYSISCAAQVGGVWAAYGTACNITTPLTQVEVWYCDIVEPDITKYLACYAVEGATQYRFEISEGANVYTYTSTNVGFRMSNFANIKYNTTYSVRAAAYVGGSWTAYGAACNITTPLTKMQTWYCGITASSMTQYMACYAVNGATQYRFKLVDGGTTLYYTSTGIGLRFSLVPGIQINTAYSVSVAAYVGGSWTAYGDACTITSAASMAAQGKVDNFGGAMDGQLMGDVSLEAYPNPNAGNFVITSSDETSLRIVNELGQVLHSVNLNKENGYQTTVEGLEDGVYFITGTINGELITKKVMVMK